jgi:ribosomal protein S18 acetylase RimI-like enzyme
MTVRAALNSDVDAVRELVRLAFLPYVPRLGVEPMPMGVDYRVPVAEGRCWVDEHDDQIDVQIVGMVQCADSSTYLEVETLAVAPDMRGRGVGSRLLGFAEERARALGLAEVRLYTNEAMTENLEFYPRRGYQEVGRETQHGFRRVLFAKSL